MTAIIAPIAAVVAAQNTPPEHLSPLVPLCIVIFVYILAVTLYDAYKDARYGKYRKRK